MEMPNILHRGGSALSIEIVDDFYDGLSYYKTLEDFDTSTVYSQFIKDVERLVRNSSDYKQFIAYMRRIGLDRCQVLSKIQDGVDATVEIHHFPFTLYDICENELIKFLQNGIKVNTFRVADSVINLHYALKVGCVSLSITMHEAAHNEDLFLNINTCFGNLDEYIKEYATFLSPESKYKLWNYIDLCKKNPSFDKGILDLENVKTYIKAS